MTRAALTFGLLLLATPAAAQWLGEPTWNHPNAGSGFAIYGDYTKPNSDVGGGNAFGGRVALGAGVFTLTGGVSSWDPDAVNERLLTIGGTAAFRLLGGSLIPVAVNLQLGGGHSLEITSSTTTLPVRRERRAVRLARNAVSPFLKRGAGRAGPRDQLRVGDRR